MVHPDFFDDMVVGILIIQAQKLMAASSSWPRQRYLRSDWKANQLTLSPILNLFHSLLTVFAMHCLQNAVPRTQY